jgi:putative ABC transport system permease protein
MKGFLHDLRHALRSLARSPGFTAASVVMLALGIGANTLVFSLLHSLLLRPFPFRDLDRLVTIWEAPPERGAEPEVHRSPLKPGDSLDLAREATSFESFAAFRYRELRLTGADVATPVRAVAAGPGFFETLGVAPSVGTAFGGEDYEPGRDRVAILSHGFWTRQLGADPNIVSREIALDGERYTVRGVMPPEFHYPLGGVDLWTPLALGAAEQSERGAGTSVLGIARLRKSASLPIVRAEIDGVARALERRYPRTNAGRRFTVVPLRAEQAAFTGPFVVAFGAAAGFVLLVACANVANLLLARATASRRDVAIRFALGAGRWRIGRQLAAESLWLSLGALALSGWLVAAGLEGIRRGLPDGIAIWLAGWRSIGFDTRSFLFACAIALATTMVFGLLPLSRAWREGLSGALDRRVQASSTLGRRGGLSRGLVVAQIGLALVLLAGAAATVKGFARLADLYRGFDPERVATMNIGLSEAKARDPIRSAGFFEEVVSAARNLPGVRSAAFVSQLPADLGPIPTRRLHIEGRSTPRPAEEPIVDLQTITPDYFRTLGIRWIRGRGFNIADSRETAPVTIISQSAARRLFPEGDPIGQRVAFVAAGQPDTWRRVVGVVDDVQQYWLDRQPRPTFYVPLPQAPARELFLVVRTEGDPGAITAAVRRSIAAIDPAQPVGEVRTLSAVIGESVALVRIAVSVLGAAGSIALLLGAAGIFALVSYTAARSTREIGIRMALGAGAGDVLRSVMGSAARLSLLGAGIGLAGGWVLTRALSSVLFGIAPGNAATLAAATAILLAAAAAACYLPARRATRIDPMTALRSE